MSNNVFKKAKWIADKRYIDKEPADIRLLGLNKNENPNHDQDLKNNHTLYRMKFDYKEGTLIFRYSADDVAKIYVNGTFIDMGPAPSYHFNCGYLEIDMTEYVVEGENLLAAHVYYFGELNKVTPSGDYRIGLIAELENDNEIIAYTDGDTKCKVTDAYGNGETIGYKTQYLEHFDANLWEYDWYCVEFDDTHWDNAYVKTNNDHVFEKQITERLAFYDVAPVSVTELNDTTRLYDLGREHVGTVYLEATGDKGSVINVMCAEELDENGHARYDMRCNCYYKQTFTLAGEENEFPEFYDYMGFRYIQIEYPKEVKIDKVKMVARNYPLEYNSTHLKSDNNLMNDIWTICKNGVQVGSQEGYLDCPTREKGLFLGDLTVTAQSHFYLTGDLNIYKRALKCIGQSTHFTPAMKAIAPCNVINPCVDYSFQYPMNLLFYYKHSGDKEFLREMLPYCETMMNYFKGYEKNGLIVDNTTEHHLVDWPRNPYDFSDGYDYDLSRGKTYGTHNVINIFHIGAQQSMNQIYDILEMPYEDRLPMLKEAYIKAFYDDERHLFKDTETSDHTALHSNVLPLYFGVAPLESVNTIVEMIDKKRLNCGVYMSYFVLKALCKHDRKDLALDIMLSEDRFSWHTMIEQGATTCFEVWDKEYKWNTSLCHPWASAPISVFIEEIAGITPKEPGWKNGYNCELYENKRIENYDLEFHVNGYRIKVKNSHNELDTSQI